MANARVDGNAALSESNAALALRSVGASSRIEARRFVDSDANVAVVYPGLLEHELPLFAETGEDCFLEELAVALVDCISHRS